MSLEVVVRAVAIGVALAGVETLHGIARAVWLVPRVGKARAQRIGIVSGSLLAFGVCWLLVPDVALETYGEHLVLGLFLALFMASFDLLLGRYLLRRPWKKAFEDLDPRKGNLLVVGLLLLAFFPLLVALGR